VISGAELDELEPALGGPLAHGPERAADRAARVDDEADAAHRLEATP
jgi:hypothetical protein